MANFGSFEVVREVYSTQGLTVYSARRAGGPGEADFAIKVFTPDLSAAADFGDAAGVPEEALRQIDERNRDRIALQKKGAEASAFVAPVLEHGLDERGAWYVTNYYTRSVNRIIVGHVGLGADGIHRVVSCIVQGALDLKKVCGRSHGALNPTNIQISKAERVREAEVVISDPAAGSSAESERFEKADLRAIGEILYQLVRRRPLEEGSQWLILPIAMSPEWTEVFGKEAEAWLALCNRLLDPAKPIETFNLGTLIPELARLAPKPAVSKTMWMAAAAVLLLLVGGGLAAYLKFSKGSLEVTVDPPEATVVAEFRGGRPPLSAKGTLRATLPKGTEVILIAQHPDLAEVRQTITVEGGKTITTPLRMEYGVVRIDAREGGQPVPAKIYRTGVTGVVATNQLPLTFYTGQAAGATSSYTIFLEGFLPLEVKAWGRVGVTTNFTFSLVRAKPDEIPVRVNVISDPRGMVELDDQTNGLPHQQWLVEGKSYVAVARYLDWTPVTNRFVAKSNLTVSLKFPHGYASLECTNGEAAVYVGSKLISTTPRSVPWPVGEVEFTFRKDGYDDVTRKVLIQEGGQAQATKVVVGLRATVGLVRFQTQPAGGVVLDEAGTPLPENPAGGGPFEIKRKPGVYGFKARHKEFGEAPLVSVPVAKAAITNVLFQFSYGEVALRSEPEGAQFQLPSSSVWTDVAGMKKLMLRPGPMSIKAKHPALPGELDVPITVPANGSLIEPLVQFPYASLVITSHPPEAVLLLDGKEQKLPWSAPIVPLAPVEFRLKYVTNGMPVDGFVRFSPTKQGWYTNGFNFVRREWKNSQGMEFVWIPRTGEHGGYWLGKFEVTQEQFQAILGTNCSRFTRGGPNLPVDNVSWTIAQAFSAKLTALDGGRTPDGLGGRYDLPSEEDWTYFARTATADNAVFSKGMGFREALQQPTRPVGSTGNPDSFGLYDVKGNVWELCGSARAGQPFVQLGGGINSYLPAQLDKVLPKSAAEVGVQLSHTGFRVLLRPNP